MKQQTAVEWFAKITAKIGYVSTDILEQAKQMEKEQIIKSVEYGCSDWGSAKDSEQYYNENFNLGTEEPEQQ